MPTLIIYIHTYSFYKPTLIIPTYTELKASYTGGPRNIPMRTQAYFQWRQSSSKAVVKQ
jgi:hypothetical protein